MLGLKGSPTKVVRIFPPAPRGQREILSGTIEEQVEQVVKKLKEQSFILMQDSSEAGCDHVVLPGTASGFGCIFSRSFP